jgi:hypothetical protein
MTLRRLKFLATGSALALGLLPALAQAALYVTIVEGLGGQPQYEDEFAAAGEKIVAASESMTDKEKVSRFAGTAATRAAVMKHFADLGKKMTADDRAAIYLVGHGSFDGETYKFNIAGPDLSGADLKKVMEGLPGRNHFLVSPGSTSGALIEAITGVPAPRDDVPGRPAATAPAAKESPYLLIAGTRNGNERNATQFGRHFADALTSKEADLNKNNSISIQEAFDYAEQRVGSYFEDEGKLATEHAQLRGEGAAQFNLSRLNALQIKEELANADDGLAELLKRRAELDAQIEDLQVRRTQLTNADYLAQLQTLILQSAELSEQIDTAQKQGTPAIKPEINIELPATTPGGGNAF